MVSQWDRIFERTQQDAWWMPDRVVMVDRPEICYTHDPEKDPKYNLVTRISPNLDDYRDLVREVIQHQSPAGDCHFMVASPSHSAKLEQTLKLRKLE